MHLQRTCVKMCGSVNQECGEEEARVEVNWGQIRRALVSHVGELGLYPDNSVEPLKCFK